MVPHDNVYLHKTLKELALIPEKTLDSALEESDRDKKFLYEVLLEKDLLTRDNLGKILADNMGIPYVDLAKVTIPKEVLEIVPEIVAKKQQVIAFKNDEKGLHLAMSNPANTEVQQFISKKAGSPVIPYYALPFNIQDSLALYSKDIQKSLESLLENPKTDSGKDAKGTALRGESQVAKILDLLIQYAYQNKASDIHVEPKDEESLVRYRIDGVLHDVLTIPRELHDQIISRIKVLAKLRTDEHMSAQDGKMQKDVEAEELDIRVSILPIVGGEKCVLRLLSSRARQFSLPELGMDDQGLEKVQQAYAKPHGMVLSTGPTGSGKTTTIYSILKIINTRDVNIATIEDPVEYDIAGINQIQVNPKTNLTFADGLRAILRQDPDIIFVGEIRDEETAGIATNSAMTGHLVLSTLHTNDAATTLPRLIDMGIEPFLVASSVNLIIAQRLVRKICEQCKVSETISLEEFKKHVPDDVLKKLVGDQAEVRVYKGKGCEVCHTTGFIGRVGVFEILEITQEIRDLIVQKANSDKIVEKARELGMQTMFEDGVQKVLNGITTIDEVIRVTIDT